MEAFLVSAHGIVVPLPKYWRLKRSFCAGFATLF
jgi:hypothetical protein